MIFVLGIFGIIFMFLLVLIILDRKPSERYSRAIGYLESRDWEYDYYEVYDLPSKMITLRDTEDKLHRINASDILIKVKRDGYYTYIFNDNKTIDAYEFS
jgi:hypothetical protein